MKRISILILLLFLLTGCASPAPEADIAATTLPVYEFTTRLCQGTDLAVTRLINEPVSCLHDYSLSVQQVKVVEQADLVVLSGAGLEDFMSGVLEGKSVVDASAGVELLSCEHDHDHGHDHHDHETDSHIWLSPSNATQMATNICRELSLRYPQHAAIFRSNLSALLADLLALEAYGKEQLGDLSCRDLITFHDGFGYLANSFDLHILASVEEESGSEASAAELKELIGMVREHDLPAIFTEKSGSVSAAGIISRETGVKIYDLDMGMSGDSYFDAMYHNIDTIKEALQ